ELPDLEGESCELIEPESVLAKRSVQLNGEQVNQVLIQWKGLNAEEATWEDSLVMKSQFPNFCLEDKARVNGGSIDRARANDEESRTNDEESLVNYND
ncbi:RNA-directed DNA polymerase (Reverse transcriptase), partial [Trifolium medium]|nr:RNA-directed DNA polymerase (Reverse transcriptase) [Trifolium medium]